MSGSLLKSAFITLLTLTLAACGGGGGGGGDDGALGGGGGAAPTAPTLTLTILDANGNETNLVNGDVPVTARAVLQDGTGSAVASTVVTFITAVGALTPTSGNVLTDANGIAEIVLGAGTTADAGQITATATVAGVVVTSPAVGITSDGQGVGEGTENLVLNFELITPNNSVTISRDNIGTGSITVLDGNGNPVNQALVQFRASLGSLDPANGLVTTGADGRATVQILPGIVAGAGVLAASVTAGTEVVDANSIPYVTNGDELTITFDLSTPDNSITITQSNTGTATVTVIDGTLSPVDQAIVSFSSTAGLLNPASGVVTTDASGTATISLSAGSTAEAGVLSASVTVGSSIITPTDISFVSTGDAAASLNLSIASGLQNTAITNAAPQTISALVIGENGSPVQGVIITFANSGQGVLSATSDITNASGIATTNLLAGTINGFGEISATATLAGQTLTSPNDGSISFSTAGDGPFVGTGSSNLNISLSLIDGAGASLSGIVDASNPGILSALVTDALGAPVPSIVVEFVTTGFGDLFPISGLSLTNSSGIATVALNAGNNPGAGSASATLLIDGAKFNTDSLTFETLGNAGDTEIILTLNFLDKTPTNGTNIITTADSATVGILIEDASGINLANRTAQITSTLGTTINTIGGTPSSTITAISDFDGRIEVTLAAGTTLGTGDFVAIVGDTSASVQFDVGVAGLQIGTCVGGTSALDCSAGTTFTQGGVDIGSSPLSAGGTTSVGLVVVDSSNSPVVGIDIALSTNCSTTDDPITGLPQASINATLTSTANGIVSGTYQAATGCVGTDIITAVESSTGQTAIGTVSVLAPNIGAIVFNSVTDPTGTATPNISIKESGGNSTAFVVFQVLDVLGDPAPDQNVSFSLTTNVGGITLQNADETTGVAMGLTDSNGLATAILEAGFIATTVLVRASLAVDRDDDGDITDFDDVPVGATTLVSLSGQLSINTGIADQNSFSLSVTEHNFEGDEFDGEQITLTARLADRANNPVPDGTSVQFRTEYGRVAPACNTVNGDCSVILNSQNPRSPNDPNVIVKDVFNAQCPSQLVLEESVTVVGTQGATFHDVSQILRVETTGNALVSPLDYSVNSDKSGITCTGAACTGNLKITYTRGNYDRDIAFASSSPANLQVPIVYPATNPGQATAPFRRLSQSGLGIPCFAQRIDNGGAVSSGYNGGLGQIYGRRSTLLAFVQGEESFIDANSNGVYDFNEPFVDLTEAFIDYNDDGVFGNGTVGADDSRDTTSRDCYGPRSPITVPSENQGNCFQIGGEEEEFIDFGTGSTLNGKFDAGNGIYNGSLCPKDVSDRSSTCDNAETPCDKDTDRFCTRELVNISRERIVQLSGSSPVFSIRSSTTEEYISGVQLGGVTTGSLALASGASAVDNQGNVITGDFNIGHADNIAAVVAPNPNPTPAFIFAAPQIGDTTSLVSRDGGVVIDIADRYNGQLPFGTTIGFATGAGGECVIVNSSGSPVASTSLTIPSVARLNLSLIAGASGGLNTVITATITTPNNLSTSFTFNCVSTAP
ncbi:MAG: hypothetical protein ACI9FB_001590 [Candidatus Azotimanducaceae bacterium]|jgi:hypothetical protein